MKGRNYIIQDGAIVETHDDAPSIEAKYEGVFVPPSTTDIPYTYVDEEADIHREPPAPTWVERDRALIDEGLKWWAAKTPVAQTLYAKPCQWLGCERLSTTMLCHEHLLEAQKPQFDPINKCHEANCAAEKLPKSGFCQKHFDYYMNEINDPSTIQIEPPADTSPPVSDNCLEAAQKVVRGSRQWDYGTPKDNHGRTAEFWSSYLGVKIDARDVCMLNILQKVSRDTNASKFDNLIDIAGYALNAELVTDEAEQNR